MNWRITSNFIQIKNDIATDKRKRRGFDMDNFTFTVLLYFVFGKRKKQMLAIM